MMNTKIYKSVLNIAGEMMDAANEEDRETFDALYAKLKSICIDNENTNKDHPVQWETLADFTEELEDAVAGYEKALGKAVAHAIASEVQLENANSDAVQKHVAWEKAAREAA